MFRRARKTSAKRTGTTSPLERLIPPAKVDCSYVSSGPYLSTLSGVQEEFTTAHVDPRAYLRPIWARKWYILAAVVLVTAGTYVYFNHKPRQYNASAQVY